MPGGLLGQLGDFFKRAYGRPAAPKPTAEQKQLPEFQKSSVPEFQDPIVSSLNKELAVQHDQVPTEADALKQEQHAAWANYDFERSIVIFSRLRQLEPDDPTWTDKLKVSYFNRGKQYETDGDMQRATQAYYAALSLDPNFDEAKQAAQSLMQSEGAGKTEGSATTARSEA